MMKVKRMIAEAFPPGEFIREELAARGWSQTDLATIVGRPLQTINQIVNGKKEVTPETAVALGAAFGTGAEYWLNLESQYRLWLAGDPDPGIAKRAAQVSRRRSVANRAA